MRRSPFSQSRRWPLASMERIGTSEPSWITALPSSNPIPNYMQPREWIYLAGLFRGFHGPHAAARVVQRQLASAGETPAPPTGRSRCARCAESRPRSRTR